MSPARAGGRLIAAVIMAGAIVGALVDSAHWLWAGAIFAALFANA